MTNSTHATCNHEAGICDLGQGTHPVTVAPTEHRLYTQAEDDAAVVAYLMTDPAEARQRPRVGGTGAARMTREELNDYVEAAVNAGRIIEIPGSPYTYQLASELPEDAVLAVLDYFGHPAGRQAGGFVTSLLETMGRADLSNRAKLVAAFPEWGVPFVVARDVAGGIDSLAARFGA